MTHAKSRGEDAAVALHFYLTAAAAEAFGLDETLAAHFATRLAASLRKRCGGDDLYVPAPDKRARDDAIRREFCGTNADEVMRRHGISRSRLYEIAGKRSSTET